MVEKFDSLEQIEHAMIEWALECLALLQEHNSEQKTPVIHDAIQYIHANYKQQLKLEAVASHVHLTPAYFCMKFHQETGKNLCGIPD